VLVVDLGGFVAVCNTKKPRNSAGGKFNTSQDFRVLLWFGAFWLQVTSI
jgi:hypothetical protein